MEEHFLKDFVEGVGRCTQPEPWYNPDGDCIIYQMVDEAPVAERIDEILTIYHSAITDKPIGYQIKDVRAIATRCGWDGVLVTCKTDEEELKEINLYALLLAAYDRGPKTVGRRQGYAEAFESCADNPRISAKELELVC